MKKSERKLNKFERTEQKKKALEYHQTGSGMFVFKNRSNVASLELPKVSADGKKWVGPNQTWKGDSYYLMMVPKEAVLVESLEVQKKEESKTMAEKLILDQPDQITTSGRVEHSVVDEFQINEVAPIDQKIKDILITEDPLAGVTIIRD